MLNELNELPPGILALNARELHGLLGGPTLIHLPGSDPRPLFVSVLLHGNEDTGWEAMRRLLARYTPGGGNRQLPRALSLFIGNTAAAAQGLRHLDGQPDYNRVWPGCEEQEGAEQQMMRRVVQSVEQRDVFASVDVHNNTGLNPHYACINRIETRNLHLAALFGRTVVYFIRPLGVQSMAMSHHCPAVTLECGKVGQRHGVEHAEAFLDACLHLSEHPLHPIASHDVDLFHTVATVKIPDTVGFGFGGNGRDLSLAADLDSLNFRELPVGTSFGFAQGDTIPLAVCSEQGDEVAERFFHLRDGELVTRCPVMPSMLTLDETVIRQDCLCYLMERYDAHLADAQG